MKKSFKRIITTVTAVLSLSMCMIGSSVSASASGTSWGLYNTVSGPSEARKYYDAAGFYVNSKTSSIKVKCTYYSSQQQSNGSVAYASYKPYAIDSSGNRIEIVNQTYYFYGTSSEKTISLTNTVPSDSTIYGNFSLKNYSGINVTIYGEIGN